MVFLILFYGEKMFDIDSGRITGESFSKSFKVLTKFLFQGSDDPSAKSRAGNVHFTMIFNVFVLMTLFNEINARYVNNFLRQTNS